LRDGNGALSGVKGPMYSTGVAVREDDTEECGVCSVASSVGTENMP
jgi:hypothetical protein